MSKFEVLAGADKIFCDTVFSSLKDFFFTPSQSVKRIENSILGASAKTRLTQHSVHKTPVSPTH